MLLAVALQALLLRYTRGDADLSIRLGGTTIVPNCVASDRSFKDALHAAAPLAAAKMPGSRLGAQVPLTLTWRENGLETGDSDSLTVAAALTLESSGIMARFVIAAPPGDASTVWQRSRLAGHWRNLLTALAETPELPLNALPLLDEDERHLLTHTLSGAEEKAPALSALNLVEVFEHQARLRADHPAVVCDGEALTYAELDSKANQIANRLRAYGVKRGDYVGLYLPRSLDVFVGMLGILKAGAAYAPIDPDYPEERVAFILTDSQASVVLTHASMAGRAAGHGVPVLTLDAQESEIASQPTQLTHDDKAGPRDVAYIIYTSGSTGRPKGVMIEHRNALAFLAADAAFYGVVGDDRVYQGFSVAFDASVEEIWLAFAAGATLIVATADVARAGPELAGFLRDQHVTVYSTVPTALMMIEDELPEVRILILGGEECTSELVRRFSRPGRRLVNSYGPTEATVVVTATDTAIERKVTIGRPLAGVHAYVLDQALEPVPFGLPGELVIGGPTVARGYLGRPDLTAERFVQAPAAFGPQAGENLYRTGDLVRFTDGGDIEFLGRIDSQVKLRGYRIELGEIEARLTTEPGVRNAAVMLREDTPGLKQLVAYVVPAIGWTPTPSALREALRDRLPPYMLPSFVELIDELPVLPSGKVDKRRLPPPARTRVDTAQTSKGRAPTTPDEVEIHSIWQTLFAPEPVGMDDDFFLLGGHSLLATRMISEVRRIGRFADASVLDVYQHSTLTAFIQQIEARAQRQANASPGQKQPTGEQEEQAARAAYTPVANGTYARCALLQGISLYFIFALFSLNWLVPLVGYDYYLDHPGHLLYAVLIPLGIGIALFPIQTVLGIALKWLIIGRFRPGSYPIWSFYYWRFWLVKRTAQIFTPAYLRGTPFLATYYRLLGARIGRNVYLGTAGFLATDLLRIGDDASISVDSQLLGYKLQDGMLHIGSVEVGDRAVIGARSVIGLGTVLEDDVDLGPHSLVLDGARIGRGQRWQGSPARRLMDPAPDDSALGEVQGRVLSPWAYRLAFILAMIGLAPLPLLAAVPGLLLWGIVAKTWGFLPGLAIAPVSIALFVVCYCIVIAVAKRLLVGRVRPGRYHMHSWFYVSNWCVDGLLESSLGLMFPLYATLYLAPFLRMLGVRVGKLAEVSTAGHFTPDLVELGDGSFIADAVSLGAGHIAHDILTLDRVVIGAGAFVGNSACLHPGTTLGDSALIGCQSSPPTQIATTAEPDTSWVGSPGVLLPQRLKNTEFESVYTSKPTPRLFALRLFIEFWRITLPETIGLVLAISFLREAEILFKSWPLGRFLVLFPFMTFGVGVVAALSVVLLKWIIVGRYKPMVKPLWSDFVWRTELVDALHEHLARPVLLSQLQGTPLLPLYFRMLGARIGKRAVMESMNITEYDLVTIGDDVCLDNECDLQTHLFEDRVMKMSTVIIGDKCSIGPSTVVLYDSAIGDGATLAGMSLLMKGETVRPWTRWAGAPLERMPACEGGA